MKYEELQTLEQKWKLILKKKLHVWSRNYKYSSHSRGEKDPQHIVRWSITGSKVNNYKYTKWISYSDFVVRISVWPGI
jgi:hypothetical protein